MRKIMLFPALVMGGMLFINSAYATGWSCIAENKTNPPSQFSGIAPQGLSGPDAKANAKSAALQACESSPLTRYASNCHIVSCSLTN